MAVPRLLAHEHHVVARKRDADLGARGEQRGHRVGLMGGLEHDGVQRAVDLQLARRLGVRARDDDGHVGAEARERARELGLGLGLGLGLELGVGVGVGVGVGFTSVPASKSSKMILRTRRSTAFVMKGGGFVAGTSSAGGCTAARTCARSEVSSMAVRSAGSAVPPQQWHPPHLLVQAPPEKKAVGAGLVVV